MSTVTFNTLRFVERLTAAGVSDAHAKAEADALATALSESLDSTLATKSDISRTEAVLRGDIVRVERELAVLKWMAGIIVVATVLPLFKHLGA